MKRGQVWSVDVLLAMVIFVSIMMVFYIALNKSDDPKLRDLASEAAYMKTALERNPEHGFISNDAIDETKLRQFINDTRENYSEVKQSLGTKGDFCIYLEDENGNLVLLEGNLTGIGNPDVSITNTSCGSIRTFP